jgi:hypothetical protein
MLAAAGLGAVLTAYGCFLLSIHRYDAIGWISLYFGVMILLCAGVFGLKIRKQD